ncbi:MAG: Ig-like domain-containing protein [Pirellulaceae bacterium]
MTVALFFDNPFAIDDSFDVPTSDRFPLNVVANDIEGENGKRLSIVSVTQPDKGGNLSIATGNKSLRYTPSRDFGGIEFSPTPSPTPPAKTRSPGDASTRCLAIAPTTSCRSAWSRPTWQAIPSHEFSKDSI